MREKAAQHTHGSVHVRGYMPTGCRYSRLAGMMGAYGGIQQASLAGMVGTRGGIQQASLPGTEGALCAEQALPLRERGALCAEQALPLRKRRSSTRRAGSPTKKKEKLYAQSRLSTKGMRDTLRRGAPCRA